MSRGDLLVYIYRTNLLDVAVSAAHAPSINWHQRSRNAGVRAVDRTVTIEPADLLAGLSYMSRAVEWSKGTLEGIPHMMISYERDLKDGSVQQATVDRISDALGLPRRAVSTDLLRVGATRTQSRLTNFDEVADLLRRTSYAEFIDAANEQAPEAVADENG